MSWPGAWPEGCAVHVNPSGSVGAAPAGDIGARVVARLAHVIAASATNTRDAATATSAA